MRINPGIRKANREFLAEGYRQINLKIGGAGLALHRYWGYGTKRVSAMMDELLRGWNECAAEIEREFGGSGNRIVEELRKETGVEFRQESRREAAG